MALATTPAPSETPAPVRPIPVRRISFEEALADLPKYFAEDGDPIASHIIAVLSSVFPEGEDFFVRSVRHYRDQITDPQLKKQVNAFIGQEAVHGREHRAVNDRLAELGYPAHEIDSAVSKALAFRTRFLPAEWNLATTAALEHFTAVFAETILSRPDEDMIGDGVISDLLRWHAVEESEHKSVAFDVFRSVGGSERTRRIQMNVITFGFISGIGQAVLRSLWADRHSFEKGELRASWARARRHPIFERTTWRKLRDYNREDFHPNDHDTDALLDEWRERLFGDEGSLNHLISGRTAA